METKWLEDFIALAETRSFSRAAQLRHVTQPAFSRRIQALELWTGIGLVDRSSYPTRLTPAGETFHGQALEIVAALQATRNLMRSHLVAGQDMIEFAVPHTLAFTFFPLWLSSLRPQFGALKTRLNAFNVHDAVLRLSEGGCDLPIDHGGAHLPRTPGAGATPQGAGDRAVGLAGAALRSVPDQPRAFAAASLSSMPKKDLMRPPSTVQTWTQSLSKGRPLFRATERSWPITVTWPGPARNWRGSKAWMSSACATAPNHSASCAGPTTSPV
jgi:DNA-binding transcriptional LysR family regulator